MLKTLLSKLDAFEDDPIAAIFGAIILFGGLFLLLLAPLPDLAVAQ